MSINITGHTGLTCLLGSPVAHSNSPVMHNESFQALGLDFAYLAFDVKKENLKTAVEGLKALGVRGFNLTMPHKSAMLDLVDDCSKAAQISGSINTVVNENGRLTGHTTDGAGYMRAAKALGHDLIGKKMTLLGAGGAGTAILVQAAIDGLKEIHIFNRVNDVFDRAEKIAEKLNKETDCKVYVQNIEDKQVLYDTIEASDILTNATSVGMAPNTEECIIGDAGIFHKGLVVSDIIYNPEETKLLRMAREQGCEAFNGLYMLLYQGAEAFRLWTGKEMPVELIKEKYFSRT